MKNILLLLSLLAGSGLMLAQDAYDISQYKARWSKRQALTFDPQIFHNGSILGEPFGDSYYLNSSFPVNWQHNANLDDNQKEFRLNFNPGLIYSETPGSIDRRFNLRLDFNARQTHYSTANRFWGYGVAVSFVRFASDLDGEPYNSGNYSLEPEIFRGSGRIEFAEDALLANWTVDDLMTEGAIDTTVRPALREALAQGITRIIGNRTFDVRRRRIYELEQLRQVFLDNNIPIRDEFRLFAVLNDNWSFANRASLPHGRVFRYGASLQNGLSVTNSSIVLTGFQRITALQPTAYAAYQRSKIVKNNASHTWSALLEGYLQQYFYKNSLETSSRYGAYLELGFSSEKLVNSRSLFGYEINGWIRAEEDLGVRTLIFDLSPFSFRDKLGGELRVNYTFLPAFHWNLQVSAGIRGENSYFDYFGLYPSFYLKSIYAFF